MEDTNHQLVVMGVLTGSNFPSVCGGKLLVRAQLGGVWLLTEEVEVSSHPSFGKQLWWKVTSAQLRKCMSRKVMIRVEAWKDKDMLGHVRVPLRSAVPLDNEDDKAPVRSYRLIGSGASLDMSLGLQEVEKISPVISDDEREPSVNLLPMTREELTEYFKNKGMGREAAMMNLHPTRFIIEAAKCLGVKAPAFQTIRSGRIGRNVTVAIVEVDFNNSTFQGSASSVQLAKKAASEEAMPHVLKLLSIQVKHGGRKEKVKQNIGMPSDTMSREILDTLGKNILFDAHCHIDFIMFWKSPGMEFESFDQFVQAYPLMKHRSLEGFITNFCCPKIWTQHLVAPSHLIQSLLSRPSVYYTIGCHPHYVKDILSSQKFAQLELLIEKAGDNFVAVGECGIDRSPKNRVRMSEQIRIFQKQVRLAVRVRKPLVLHIRGAEKEALQAMEEAGLPHDWPIHRHCWNDTWDVCEAWLKRYTNSVVGFTPLVTFSNKDYLLHVVEKLPMDKLVLETDAPYFIPKGGPDSLLGHSNRKFSLPPHVANVAAKVAMVKQCEVKDVLTASRENIRRIYKV